jgi:hypothetical protein
MEKKINNTNEKYNNNDNQNHYSSIKELEDKTQENTILLKNEESKSTIDQIENKNLESNLPLIYGNNKILMYLNNEPFIVIGPHCKKK